MNGRHRAAVEPAHAAGDHLPALDGLRGAAMVFVFVHHAIAIPLKSASLPLDAAVRAIAYVGWTAVDAFFVLSGFLITGILLDTKGQPRWWPNYFARRALRVFPLYYAVLAILFIVLPRLVHWSDPQFRTLQTNQVWYWTYTVNVLAALTKGTGVPLNTVHFWSLAIEEQFYLIWPLLVWACKPRTLLRVVALAMLGGLALRLGLVLRGPVNPYALYMLTPCRFDGLMTGAALAVFARAPGGLARLRILAPQILRAGALALLAMALWRGGLDVGDPVVSVAAFPIVALVFGALLVLAVIAPPASLYRRALCSQGLRNWGKYSYGIYIVHLPLLGAIWWKADLYRYLARLEGSWLPSVLLVATVGLALSYTLGQLSYHLYEKRFLALKRYFEPRAIARITAPQPRSPQAYLPAR